MKLLRTLWFVSVLALPPILSAQVANNAGTNATRQEGSVKASDGILKTQGSMMLLKDGKLLRVSYEVKLSEGLIARPNGEVVLKDGKTITLQEGQMVGLDGTIGQVPPGLGSTAPGTTGSQPLDTGNKTDYGNSGKTGPQTTTPVQNK